MHPKKERNKVLWDILKQPGISYLDSLLWNVIRKRLYQTFILDAFKA